MSAMRKRLLLRDLHFVHASLSTSSFLSVKKVASHIRMRKNELSDLGSLLQVRLMMTSNGQRISLGNEE